MEVGIKFEFRDKLFWIQKTILSGFYRLNILI